MKLLIKMVGVAAIAGVLTFWIMFWWEGGTIG